MLARLLVGLALAGALALPAAAQPLQPDARPTGGTLRPRADRVPEALDLTLRGATTPDREGCSGFVHPAAPDAAVEWRGGTLRLTARSSIDVTLVVVDPQGQWHCDDDTDGLMPVVELPEAARGRYAVWVGSFVEGGGGTATLLAGRPGRATLASAADAPLRLDLAAGFAADGPTARTVTATGIDAVDALGIQSETYCNGFIDAARPTARVRYRGAGERLTVRLQSDAADPVLIVRTPGGTWLCDDDSGEGNASAVAAPAEDGDYVVWAGTFFSFARPEAPLLRLSFGEDEVVDPDAMDGEDFEGFEEMDFEPTPYSTGTYRTLDLTAAPRARLALGTQEETSTTLSVQPDGVNPITGDACRGQIEAAPSLGLTLGGDGPVGLTATGEMDLVLVVQTPGGDWFCSDDADGLHPGIQLDTIESGTYRVWVGTFAEGVRADVEVTATRGPITVTERDFGPDGGLGAGDPFAEGTYNGDALRPDAGETPLTVGASASVTAGGTLLNPVAGPTCSGFLNATPSAIVRLDGGATLRALPTDPDDLVMLVHTPDGRWICSDDADESANPRVTLDDGVPGLYSVWVGTFSRRDNGVPAVLHVEP